MANQRAVCGDDELYFWEVLGQPKTNATLPGGMQVGVNLINHDNA